MNNIRETYLYNQIKSADAKVQYDEHAKKLLADKGVLAYILMHTVEEFRGYTFDEVKSSIEDEPEICRRNVRPEAITGNSTESRVPGEGQIFFDIVFFVRLKDGSKEKMYINLEAQKSYYPGYDLVSRGVVYGSRLLSEQMDKEFTPDNYDGVKKVYSIWICMNTPTLTQNYENVADTIVEYSMQPQIRHATPNNNIRHGRYDLLSVVFINLKDDMTANSSNRLISMLSTLLSAKKSVECKKEILEKEFNLPMTRHMEKEAAEMCNLSGALCDPYEEIIARKETQIAEKDNMIAEKDNMIAEKDKIIAEEKAKNNALIEKFAELEKLLAEKQKNL